jgi:nucleoside-triphosphatase THEP1
VVELGKMELIPAPLRGAVMELLRQEVAVVATVRVEPHRFIHALKMSAGCPGDPGHRRHRRLAQQLIDRLVRTYPGEIVERRINDRSGEGGPRQVAA